MTRRRHAAIARMIFAMCLAGAAACSTPPAPAAEAVVVGATLPLTGADATQAAAMKRGYERAVAEANVAGGIRMGQATLPVRLDLRDDTSDSAALEVLTRELIEAGAHVILATPRDVRAVAEASVTEKAGVPLIGNAIDHPGLPGKRMQWMIVFPSATVDAEARAYEVATTTLGAVAAAGQLEPRQIRDALQQR